MKKNQYDYARHSNNILSCWDNEIGTKIAQQGTNDRGLPIGGTVGITTSLRDTDVIEFAK